MQTCNDALKAKNKEIELSKFALKQRQDQIANLSIELTDANGKLASPFRNPFVTVPVGILLGLLGYAAIHR